MLAQKYLNLCIINHFSVFFDGFGTKNLGFKKNQTLVGKVQPLIGCKNFETLIQFIHTTFLNS